MNSLEMLCSFKHNLSLLCGRKEKIFAEGKPYHHRKEENKHKRSSATRDVSIVGPVENGDDEYHIKADEDTESLGQPESRQKFVMLGFNVILVLSTSMEALQEGFWSFRRMTIL